MGTFFVSTSHSSKRALPAWSRGYSLIELLLVVAVLGVCLAVGSLSLAYGLRTQEARGAAQSWQAAATWAQIGVLWHGGSIETGYTAGRLALTHDQELCGGDVGSSAPAAPVRTNLARWREIEGVAVSFKEAFASPDGGGSLFFDAHQGSYRVVVRPESGFTTRTRITLGP